LSRLEGSIALEALARRFPHARLVDPAPDWLPSMHFLGLRRLDVVFEPQRAAATRGPISE
jgi:cytochrome P450